MVRYWLRYWVVSVCVLCGSLLAAEKSQQAVIKTQYGDITVALFPKVAPKHVENFLMHAKEKHYDGTLFHRVIPGFVVQGGDPNTKTDETMHYGMGGNAAKYFGVGEKNNENTWKVPAEFNHLKHKKGTLSMARSQDPDSAGSQFFICLGDIPHLDGQYTVFGHVIKGFDAIEKIAKQPTNAEDMPIKQQKMLSVRPVSTGK